MDTDFIEDNVDIFVLIIQRFEDDARLLVDELAEKYNLEIDAKIPVNTFFEIKNKAQSENINQQWSYFLHGNECRFIHENGQVVEVLLTFSDEYGALDPLFPGKYIRTNPDYKNIGNKISDEFENGLKILNRLKANGLLMEIRNKTDVIVDFENAQAICVQRIFKGVKLKNQENRNEESVRS